jgi:hypothetical protein
MSQRASWDWKEVCGRSIPQLEQGSKRPAGFEVCSPMEGQAHRRSGVACILDIGKIRGGGHPLSPRRGLWKREKGLVPGKTKSDAAEVAGIRHEADDAEPPGGTHPPRNVVPRTTAKGVSAGRNSTLLLTPVIALRVCRTRPLCNVTTSIYPKSSKTGTQEATASESSRPCQTAPEG